MEHALRIWRLLPNRRRRQFGWLTVLSVLAAFAEALTIGTILPFLLVLSNPAKLLDHAWVRIAADAAGIHQAQELLFPVSLFFCAVVVCTGAIRLVNVWAGTHVSFAAGSDLSNEVFERTVHQSYESYLLRSSTELMDLMITAVNTVIFDMLIPLVAIVSSAALILMVTATLFVIDPMIALLAFVGIGVIYFGVALATRSTLASFSVREASSQRARLQTISESFGGMRDVILSGCESMHCDAFRVADRRNRVASVGKRTIGQSPRFVVEALAMTLVAVLAYTLASSSDGLERSIPVLGAFALGAQRLLPAAQTIYSSWSSLRGASAYLQKLSRYFDETTPPSSQSSDRPVPLPFQHLIRIDKVSFSYPATEKRALSNLSLAIPAGSRTGIIGASGSGKSTLTDLLLGLLKPSSGSITVDGQALDDSSRRAWQANIAHVPQSVFLADASIAENIAFGIAKDEIDLDRVAAAARQARIDDYVATQPRGYETIVGERGIRLSGGQRQRLGIARALYRRSKILVLDEATSALDNETEQAVMASIDALSDDLTIIVIAHRLSTLRGCDQVVELEAGRLVRSGSYSEVTATI